MEKCICPLNILNIHAIVFYLCIQKNVIKPCNVILVNECFSKLKMRCTIVSSENESIPFTLRQTDSDRFTIKIRSKRCELKTPNTDEKPVGKIAAATTTIATIGEVVSSKRSRQAGSNESRVSKRKRTEEPSKPPPFKRRATKKTVALRNNPAATPCKTIYVGDVVLCKIRGWCNWPAYITEIDKNVVSVEFFGDHTTHKTTIQHLFSFLDSSIDILANLTRLKDPLFSKSVKEAEGSLKIPSNQSIFHQLKNHS